jgi:hypothetical protein
MKRTNIFYWITTGLFAFVMFGSAVPDLLVMPVAVKGFAEIGLPAYLLPLLGLAKILGVIAILIQGNFPRIKEWAYAGLMTDIIGGTYCVAAAGKTVAEWTPMLLFIALGFTSYALYHKRRTLKAARAAGNEADLYRLQHNAVGAVA